MAELRLSAPREVAAPRQMAPQTGEILSSLFAYSQSDTYVTQVT